MGKALMVQGTASSVGKSFLATGFCRLFAQEGFKVAPFKAQNMSLNAAVTAEGGEIGRAQAVQAEAASIEPTVDMNPILLKPEADAHFQVIVRGRLYATMSFQEYRRETARLLPVIRESLERLLASYDLVIIEGAGSPAEVNLKEDDIVNMGIARMAKAPVLLIGDIDRGGVFASLVGTMELLSPEERCFVKGFIINKFRGDPTLLQPGLVFLEERTGVPVLGVLPYLRDLRLPAEDSVSLESAPTCSDPSALLDIAVIHLPRISNFDDFEPLIQEPGVSVRYVHRLEQLASPDLIILPGTKSTASDLLFLEKSGLAQEVRTKAGQGVPIIGICGGYQLLGERVLDPHRVESEVPEIKGLSLLPVDTIFKPAKATHRVKAVVVGGSWLLKGAEGVEVKGYEIHMGETIASHTPKGKGGGPFLVVERSGSSRGGLQALPDYDGAAHEKGHIFGTYLHGLFHNRELRVSILRALAGRKGLKALPRWGELPSREEEYDRLAALLRTYLNVERLFAICGLGP
ncbi:MAG: cobyric acid synthase [Candidatus Methylomirabilales bacterium]